MVKRTARHGSTEDVERDPRPRREDDRENRHRDDRIPSEEGKVPEPQERHLPTFDSTEYYADLARPFLAADLTLERYTLMTTGYLINLLAAELSNIKTAGTVTKIQLEKCADVSGKIRM